MSLFVRFGYGERRKMMIEQHLKLLGMRMRDRVTGFTGMVDCVSFDAYGCIQAVLRPKGEFEGKVLEGAWFDVKRLEKAGGKIMEPPAYLTTKPGDEIGSADKPAFDSRPARCEND
jgi:hypothetical protein